MASRHVACVQCGTELRGTEARAISLIVGTVERAYPACRDTEGCRARWWGEAAYYWELNPA